MRIRTISPTELRFMVNPMPVKGRKYRGQQIYASAVHIDREGRAYEHPYSFWFVMA